MRVVLTGGCTGGHIYPALAIGDIFREKQSDCEILYLGHDEGMERYIVPQHGYELRFIRSRWVDRSNVFKLFNTLWSNEIGKHEAKRVLKAFQPDLVFSTGSFVSVPVVLAAQHMGIPVYIHEQNAYPGMANKILSKHARKVFLGFQSAAKYFDEDKVVYSGNPVRRAFGQGDRKAARQALEIPEEDFVVLLFGGSLGASTLNEIGRELAVSYAGKAKTTLLFGTGRDYYDAVKEELDARLASRGENIRVTPYISDMADAIAASDVVISRSGALSVAEITACGRAAIFVPSPNVTGDHQYYNAKAVFDQGGAIIVTEDGDAAMRVRNTVEALQQEPSTVAAMEAGSRKAAAPYAAEDIYRGIMDDLCGQI